MEYDHLDYHRPTTSYKPHYHRLSDTSPTKDVNTPTTQAPPPPTQHIMLPDGMPNNISNVTDTTNLDLPSTSSTSSLRTPSTGEPSPSLERKIRDALIESKFLDPNETLVDKIK